MKAIFGILIIAATLSSFIALLIMTCDDSEIKIIKNTNTSSDKLKVTLVVRNK